MCWPRFGGATKSAWEQQELRRRLAQGVMNCNERVLPPVVSLSRRRLSGRVMERVTIRLNRVSTTRAIPRALSGQIRLWRCQASSSGCGMR